MKVLIIYGSRHRATEQIAQALGVSPIDRGLEVDIRQVHDAGDIDQYDAFAIGSAIYMGRWLKSVTNFIKQHQRLLQQRPDWLFTSGPIGSPALPEEEPAETAELARDLQARGAASFAGRLRKGDLGWSERLVVNALKAKEGDFRDWDSIYEWDNAIADALGAAPKVAV
jgi:menaquinone-dependent protoporphyrinogen oxidase